MKLYLKYLTVALGAVLFIMDGAFAQEEKDTKSGEIVMHQSELDSLLNKIKRYKQKQRDKERKAQKALSKARYDSIMGYSGGSQRPETASRGAAYPGSSYYNDERIFNEFARLNNRIDWMILNMNGGRAQFRSGNSQGGNGQPNVIYFDSDRDDDTPPFSPGMLGLQDQEKGANTATENQKTIIEKQQPDDRALKEAESKSSDLENRLAEMNEKARVLNKLQETTGSDEYQEELSGLNSEIEELKNELAESKRQAEEERERLASQKNALKALRAQTFSIHFANNSTQLSGADKKAIKDLAEKVKDKEDVTVILHGYASKSGNAYYNEQLSYKRANQVRQVFREAGVQSRDIVIMPHGVDENGDAEAARRVDIELSAY